MAKNKDVVATVSKSNLNTGKHSSTNHKSDRIVKSPSTIMNIDYNPHIERVVNQQNAKKTKIINKTGKIYNSMTREAVKNTYMQSQKINIGQKAVTGHKLYSESLEKFLNKN